MKKILLFAFVSVLAFGSCRKGDDTVTNVLLDREQLALEVGSSGTLKASVVPGSAVNQTVKWSSSDETVATVDQDGKVTAIDLGMATITVTTVDGGFTAECAVTVSAPPVDGPTMTMTTATIRKFLSIGIAGPGSALIDWGDGKVVYIALLKYYPLFYINEYSDISSHTVTITGDITILDCLLTVVDGDPAQITSLDVSSNTALNTLICSDNQLTTLDVSKNHNLRDLSCYGNRLTSLNVNNTSLTYLDCSDNQLTSLDAGTIHPQKLYCRNNKMDATALDDLFRSLRTGGNLKSVIAIGGNPGASECDRSIAEAKGWTVLD